MEEIARLESERNLLMAPGESGVIRRHLDHARTLCEGLADQFGGDWEMVWQGMARSAPQPGESFSPEALLSGFPPLRDALAAGGGVEGARRRWQAFRGLEETAQNAEREIASILKAYECRDFAQIGKPLHRGRGAVEKRAAGHAALGRRVSEGLPSPEDEGAKAEIDERLAGLVQDERSLEQEIDALGMDLTQLTLRQAELRRHRSTSPLPK